MSQAERVPDPIDVAREFNCCVVSARTEGCPRPSECWPRGTCVTARERLKDPRPGARKRESSAIRGAVLAHRECACGNQASDGHHVLFRSLRGDDVPENIRPLCHHCHMAYHNRDSEAIRVVGEGLLPQNILYVLRKLGPSPGVEYLRRYYSLPISHREGRRLLAEAGLLAEADIPTEGAPPSAE